MPQGGNGTPEQRRGGLVAVQEQGRVGVEEEIADGGRRLRRQRHGAGGPCDVDVTGASGEPAADPRCGERVEEGDPSLTDVQRRKLAGRAEQDSGRLASLVQRVMNGPLDTRGEAAQAWIVKKARHAVEQGLGMQGFAGGGFGLGSGQDSPQARRGIWGEHRGAGEKCAGGGPSSPAPRPVGGLLELGGDSLVRPCCSLSPVPRPQISARAGIGGLGERCVNSLAIYEGRTVIDRGADERVTEPDGGAEGHQLVGFGGTGGTDPEAEVLPGAPEQSGISGRVGGRCQQQGLRGGGQASDLAEEPGLQASAQRQRLRQWYLAGQLPPGQLTAQFNQRERVSAGLRDDPLTDLAVEFARRGRREQLTSLGARQTADPQLRESR